MKSWTQGCALEARVEVVAVSKAIKQRPSDTRMAPEGPSERRTGVPDFNHGSEGDFCQDFYGSERDFCQDFYGSEGDFCQDFYGSERTFARITIKIAKGIIALVFNQGNSESVSKRIHKVQACLKMALDWR